MQGAEVVKEDIIDDIARDSGPYLPPEKIMRRSDMATDFSTQQQRTIKPNELVPLLVALVCVTTLYQIDFYV